MKKTPLAKLIELLEIESGFYNENDHIQDRMYKLGIEHSIEKATVLLKEERDAVELAYHTAQIELLEISAEYINGISKPDKEDTEDAKQYFNENFEQ